MRQGGLNLMTLGATVLLLVTLALPAKRTVQAAEKPRREVADAPTPRLAFGVYVDPWHIDDSARIIGAKPTIAAKFEAFSKRRTIDDHIDEAERQGIRQLLVSWEPWKPVPAARGAYAQGRPQSGYRNRDLAGRGQDEYIRSFARNLATFDGVVFLRYAHEMNGYWYPWSHDPYAYRRAWRHVVTLFRDEGATNVRFVWSVNPSLYVRFDMWARELRAYWPGSRWVDVVGSTMINFGGHKNYTVERFAPRLLALRRTYGKQIMLTEVNTEYVGRVRWLRNLRRLLRQSPWIRWLAWSQLPSRGKAQMKHVGQLNWDVRRDPASARVIRQIIRDGMR